MTQLHKTMTVDNTPMADSTATIDDAQFIKDLRRGDSGAVTRLYNTYANRIYSIVFNQVDRDHDATQDIVQETFVAALKSVANFRNKSKIYTWLCSIANRKVADFYRRRKRQNNYQTEALEVAQIGSDTLAPDFTETGERQEDARQALSSLPLHYRQVLIFKYVEEMPVLEISKIMERSPKSIEGLLTRARKELRARLATPNEG